MCDCDDLGENKLFNQKNPIARTTHKCSECEAIVATQESYHSYSGLTSEGVWFYEKLCNKCNAYTQALEEEGQCWVFGMIRDSYAQLTN